MYAISILGIKKAVKKGLKRIFRYFLSNSKLFVVKNSQNILFKIKKKNDFLSKSTKINSKCDFKLFNLRPKCLSKIFFKKRNFNIFELS